MIHYPSNTEYLHVFILHCGTSWIENFHINALLEAAVSFDLLISLDLFS